MGCTEQIHWYERELKKLKDANFDLTLHAVRLENENDQLKNLLFVLTRKPDELETIREKLSDFPPVENAPNVKSSVR